MRAKIMVGIPTLQSLSMATYTSLPALKHKDVAIELHFNVSTPLDRGRNEIIKKFLESDCTHLLFLDTDVILPRNILTLLDRDKAVVSAIYGIWKDAMPVHCIFRRTKERGLYKNIGESLVDEELVEIDGCGLGCILIKREVLEKLSPPWCSFSSWDEEQGKMRYAEDFHFCEKVKRAGYTIYADAKVLCGHVVKANILEIVKYIGAGVERELIIEELKRFTGLKEEYIREYRAIRATEELADEWRKANPQSEKEKDSFYIETPWYIFDLAYYNTLPKLLTVRRAITETIKGRILDYGGGIGTYLIDCWKKGLRDLTYLDVKGKTWAFAEWRFKQREMAVKMIEPHELKGKYDGVILMDVVEHLTNWRAKLRHLLKNHVADEGVIFISETFEEADRPLYPMHAKVKKGELKKFLDKALKGKKISYCLWQKVK